MQPGGTYSLAEDLTVTRIGVRGDAVGLTVALARLLQRTPNILLSPGTASVADLGENVGAATLTVTETT